MLNVLDTAVIIHRCTKRMYFRTVFTFMKEKSHTFRQKHSWTVIKHNNNSNKKRADFVVFCL